MDISYKKIKNILEYILIFIMFFIGIRKGGYYKEDSLIGVYIIQLIALVYYIFNLGKIKINKVVGISLMIFSFSYFIPLFIQNTATVSGAINIATRIYSMYLVYIIISNSENKEKYIKALCVFTVICGIFALDEMSYKLFEKTLNFIGGGYIENNSLRIGSIFQYSNLLAILCLVSILYLIKNMFQSIGNSKLKIITRYVLIEFLTIIMLITQSKMAIILYMFSTVSICIINKKYETIIDIIICILSSLIVIALTKSLGILVIISSLIFVAIYGYLNLLINNRKNKIIFYLVCLLIIGIVSIFIYNFKIEIGILERIKEYFNGFDSTKLRFTYYKDALKLITATPINFIFGMGGNSFRTMYETVQEVNYISLEVHSFFIQVFLESGLVGIISMLISLIYLIKNSKDKNYTIILLALIIFAAFDVFLTYTFMLYVLVIIMALVNVKEEECTKSYNIINMLMYALIFVLLSLHVIAFFIEPIKVDNLNNSLKEQEKVVNKCEITLKFDSFDIEYMRNYTVSCNTYIDILEIQEEIYGVDNSKLKYEMINKIYGNVQNEIKYEKSNKYAIEDYVYYVYKYLDELVIMNYSGNEKEGYEIYLENMLKEIQKLQVLHNKNEYAMEVYKKSLNDVYIKYVYVNNIINSHKISDILDTIEENEYISL